METKHTKGEWIIQQQSQVLVSVRDKYNNSISDVWSIQPITQSEMCANAKLIAAAPELLEALIEVRNWASEFGMGSIQYEKVNNTIKKATE